MLGLLWLVPAFPLLGFLVLTLLSGTKTSRRTEALIGVGSVGVSALLTILIGLQFVFATPTSHEYVQILWTWMNTAGFTARIAFHLDDLSLVMMFVVTFVGFLIHLYSAEFMIDDEGYARFFSYMNLFVGSMLVLVLADNLLLLYLGWEAVGLCSFLLIGYWYQNPANGRAARKAFIVTRIGDTAMAIGLFLLFDNLGTLDIQALMGRAVQEWPIGSSLAIAAAALLLGGALGKSAQLPLQIWLPDAMAGPSPVSALIHAATMVTAGVYLIARLHILFSLAPVVLSAIALIGAATLLLAGFSALVQRDIKRVLAYSTMSQIGYMFLALGVGAWSAAIFHLMTHAFFKALLFLGAGVVIIRLDHEHDMFKMGGLRKQLPLVFWTFLIGAASLSALPLVTAGFYSKDKILWEVWSSTTGGVWLWAAGLIGALLTSLYTFRMVFLTFFGEPQPLIRKKSPLKAPGLLMSIPLITLAILSIVGGVVDLPATLGNLPLLSDFLHNTLPPASLTAQGASTELILQILAASVSLGGVLIAYLAFLKRRSATARLTETPVGAALYKLWFNGWGFDWLDNELVVRPFLWLARKDKNDIIDKIFDGIAVLNARMSAVLSASQTGRLRDYLLGIVIGAVAIIALVVLL
ncbi:MAG: NADH-quinone oxidoreductase subunit L [Anaerolineales bacterium]|jgi:NADH-quinone oxidoreductase subunit L